MLTRLRPILAPVLLLLAPSLLPAQSPQPTLLLSPTPTHFTLQGPGTSKAHATHTDQSWHVEVRDIIPGDYNLQLAAPITPAPKKGDVLLLTARARLISTADESGDGRISFVLEQAKDPYDKTFTAPFALRPGDWQTFNVPVIVNQDYSKTGAHLTVRLGGCVQTLEVADVTLRAYPPGTPLASLPRTPLTYPGRAPDALWRKSAAARIDQIRKAPLTISVKDPAGHPVPRATVTLKMTRNAFPFGSCYSPKLILDPSPTARKYRDLYLENFNTGVDEVDMKWPNWVKPDSREQAIGALAWMHDHHIQVRGHTLVWPGWKRLPPELKDLANDPQALSAKIHDHITEEVTALKGQVIDWDVVNEPFANNDLLKILGEDAMADWFKTARAADPAPTLYLNETSVPTSPPSDVRYTALYNRAKNLTDLGAPIGGVGMQSHFSANVQPPTQLLAIYDRFATLGLPVRITELDIDTNDRQLQADYFRDFLTASFSHPNVNGILLWGFWEGAHWRADAAMYDKDFSPRPLAKIWHDLVLKEWSTNLTTPTTSDGTLSTRAFLGDYTATASTLTSSREVHFTLNHDGTTVAITLP